MSQFELPPDNTSAARVHSSEIAAHEFPRARKGLDPNAVKSWLTLVAAAHAGLEDELTQIREERDKLRAAMSRAGREPASAEVRAALMQTQLRRRAGGYDRGEVEKLLRAAATELARAENRAALVEAQLDAGRTVPQSVTETLDRLEREVASLRTEAVLREMSLD